MFKVICINGVNNAAFFVEIHKEFKQKFLTISRQKQRFIKSF